MVSTKPIQSESATRVSKLVIFRTGSLNLALPIGAVKKIINHTTTHGSGLGSVGIVHLGDRDLTAIDLHKRLFKIPQPQEGQKRYLILIRNSAGEPFCIIVDETPAIVDVPLSQIRTLPESYRRADTLEVASHVALIASGEEQQTVFLLDVERLLPTGV